MQAAIKLNTRILPGKRIEFTSPDLPENGEVEVIIVLPGKNGRIPMLDLVASLPVGPRSASSWDELDRSFQEERDAWDR